MSVDRVVYTSSGIKITSAKSAVGGIDLQTVQNATFTVNIPRENVNTLGAEGTVFRPQLDAPDASIEFNIVPATSGSPKWSATVADDFIDTALSGDPSGDQATVEALGIGKVESALMNSLSCEATVGAMANMTISFTGSPSTAAPPNTLATPASPTSLTLVQSKDVTVSDSTFKSACAQSASVAWDLPVVNVLCLGGDPADPSKVYPFGNPPGTSSMTIEGLDDALRWNAAKDDYKLSIGAFEFELAGGFVDSQTNSVAVGDVFATFNYVIGGTADSFTIN